jgi:hypothetical protein
VIRAIGQFEPKERKRRKAKERTESGTFTVRELSERFRVNQTKVLSWLRSGELIGVNVAASTISRPNWRITAEAVAMFEKSRSSVPLPKVERRRVTRTASGFVEYF